MTRFVSYEPISGATPMKARVVMAMTTPGTLEVSLPATRAIKAGFWLLWLGLWAFISRRPGPTVELRVDR